MFGLNKVEDDVAWLLVGYLVGFAFKSDKISFPITKLED
jgi:hypothetical protein